VQGQVGGLETLEREALVRITGSGTGEHDCSAYCCPSAASMPITRGGISGDRHQSLN
jgi:hypothetical protein